MSAGHGDAHEDAHHGGGHHGGNPAMEWLDTHMSGIITPVGQRLEAFFERMMFFIVNGFFKKVAVLYMVIFTPVLLIEFVLHYTGL